MGLLHREGILGDRQPFWDGSTTQKRSLHLLVAEADTNVLPALQYCLGLCKYYSYRVPHIYAFSHV